MTAILQAINLSKTFCNPFTEAVKNVSFHIEPGECLGLIGGSGSGKSTLAQLLMGVYPCDTGTLLFDNQPLDWNNNFCRKKHYKNVQLIFQNPYTAFHPYKSIGDSIIQPLLHNGYNNETARKKLTFLLASVELSLQQAETYPHQLSGGECQRAAIARAISISPRLLICDEITSALDVQTQSEIIQLLLHLQSTKHMSLLFISHDITLVQEICTRILVMQNGQIIENGSTYDIINHPQQKYTKALIDAAKNITQLVMIKQE